MSTYTIVNPATGEPGASFPEASDADISSAMSASTDAFADWRTTKVDDRAALLARVADLFEERSDDLAALITQEMGKPVRQAKGEIAIVVSIYRYYATNGPAFLADEPIEVAKGQALVRKSPLGPLLGVMPWNFPYYQVARFAAPNLMLGNTVLLKPAPQCPSSALAIQQIHEDAGLPAGAYQTILASNEQIADVIADPRLQGVSVTGSERAGTAVAENAGRNLTKVVLELGGSDPFLVVGPVDVDRAVKHAMMGRFANAGQACNAAKRLIVVDDLYEEFLAKYTAAVQAITPGDPTSKDTFFGPMSSEQAVQTIAEQVDAAVAGGATVVVGGSRIDRAGAWYEPTLLTDVTPDMRAYSEELFGPVSVLYRVASVEDAISLANGTTYGLSAVVQCDDEATKLQIADQLEAGMVFVNTPSESAAELPFGGVKRSGIGRELGRYGMEEFVNHKLVRVRA